MKKIIITVFGVFALLIVSCSAEDASFNANDSGQGGSLARFAIVNDFLYIVDNKDIATYSVLNPETPVFIQEEEIDYGIETIYPFNDYVFIGSQTGMYVYDIATNGVPQFVSEFEHVETCDPVVANTDYAYVTLRSGRSCGGFVEVNRMEIINIQDINNPYLEGTIDMQNPKGLGIDYNQDVLFVCDGTLGVLVYDINIPHSPVYTTTISGFEANDVIVNNGTLIVVGPEGVRQFDYSDINNITELSMLVI